jgi:hypothetical protein
MTYSARSFSSKPSAKKPKKTKTQPGSCPTCGGVECFERPRFFGGQLLTDKDLEAAQRYVIEKNKLHNRYLVGTGVVCGLAVRCDPCCDGSVTVEPGYAIDCCGNDIVLCQPETFNILDCLEKQRQEEEPYCGTKIRTPKSRGDEQPKEYCLVLFYDEEPANPITALIRDNGCSNTRCEPSRIRETFRFGIIEKQADEPRKNLIPDESFLGQVRECFNIIQKLRTSVGAAREGEGIANAATTNSTGAFVPSFYQMRNYVLEFYKQEPEIRCDLPAKVAEIEAKFQAATNDNDQYRALILMAVMFVQLLLDCMCNALLVPCADCDEEEGVLLACLTVRGHKIEKICNTVRKQLIAGPSLQYWMQPLFSSFETIFKWLCCELDLVKLVEEKLPNELD